MDEVFFHSEVIFFFLKTNLQEPIELILKSLFPACFQFNILFLIFLLQFNKSWKNLQIVLFKFDKKFI